jgi:hypothetical protein
MAQKQSVIAGLVAVVVFLMAGVAQARPTLSLEADVPVVVPLGFTSDVGAGFTPQVQLDLGDHFGINLASGFFYYTANDRDADQLRVIPVLAGVTFSLPTSKNVTPYARAWVGYSYVSSDLSTEHWPTAALEAGVLLPLARQVHADVGIGALLPDMADVVENPPCLMLSFGVRYSLM